MFAEFRIKHGTGVRVAEFCRANPVDVPRFPVSLASLEAALKDFIALDARYGDGRGTVRAAIESRDAEQARIEARMSDIIYIGKCLAREDSSLRGYLQLPRVARSAAALLGRGRQLAAKVAGHLDKFTEFGINQARLDEFMAMLDAFEAELARSGTGRRTHVGATRDMREASRRIMAAIEDLHAIYRVALAADPVRMAAWESARNIPWRNSKSALDRRQEEAQTT